MEKIQEMVESLVALIAEIPAEMMASVFEAAFKVAFAGPGKQVNVPTKTAMGEKEFPYEEPLSLFHQISLDGITKTATFAANDRRAAAAAKFRSSLDLTKVLKKADAATQQAVYAALKAAGLMK
jgi:hypothetical protein